jgi:hypothetical protein
MAPGQGAADSDVDRIDDPDSGLDGQHDGPDVMEVLKSPGGTTTI